jgi:2-(1,2-epoxy-1,2-dihydrophenyl)acetyl-CoA isomerase
VLGTAFTGIGLTCDSGLSVTLPAAVGMPRARALLLRPSTFTAEQAVSWGLPFELVPADQVLRRAAEAAAQARLATTADHGNAVRAFLAKQQPAFRGK